MSSAQVDNTLDLKFCLALLEAESARAGYALDIYLDVLAKLRELREASGAGWTEAATRDKLGSQPLAALRWIQQSCRSEIHEVTRDSKILVPSVRRLASEVQLYWISSGPPDREKMFQELKAVHGSCFAFHGSAPGNWSSILRYGLRSLSGSELMTHGALHGDGVYLATAPGLAASYSGMRAKSATDASAAGSREAENGAIQALPKLEDMKILALCEVVDVPAPGLNKPKAKGIWVASQDGIVAPRLLMVLPKEGMTTETVKMLLGIHRLPSLIAGRAVESSLSPAATDTQKPDAGKNHMITCPATVVKIPAFAERGGTTGKTHVAFKVEAKCGSNACEEDIWRRYSDFEKLRDRIGDGPRKPFPGKLPLRSLFGLNPASLEERRASLEQWLQEVLSVARHGLLREQLCPELCAFLGVWGT